MKIFKFGGASVKDADSVRNVAHILNSYSTDKLLVVISAMGKSTNLLESLVKEYFAGNSQTFAILQELKDFHYNIAKQLFEDKFHPIFNELDNLFLEIECMIEKEVGKDDFDFIYDQIVSYGEFISTKIVSAYLLSQGINNKWVDARNFIFTDSNYREGRINWGETERIVSGKLKPFAEKNRIITQGFIGKDRENATTTLGREGSDYSAAIFAWCLDAESVTIWKDVAGVMNADPKKLENAIKLNTLTFDQAIELAYYGASVIHPKTIQPLKSKNIPLHVKSFVNPEAEGTEVSENMAMANNIPCFIFKENQCLLTLKTKDFSFIAENNLQEIFRIFAVNKVRINVMQNSAISFSALFDFDDRKVAQLEKDFALAFDLKLQSGLRLVSVYNAKESIPAEITKGKNILMEQKSDNILHLILE